MYVYVHALFIPAFLFIREAFPSVPATVVGSLLTAQRRAWSQWCCCRSSVPPLVSLFPQSAYMMLSTWWVCSELMNDELINFFGSFILPFWHCKHRNDHHCHLSPIYLSINRRISVLCLSQQLFIRSTVGMSGSRESYKQRPSNPPVPIRTLHGHCTSNKVNGDWIPFSCSVSGSWCCACWFTVVAYWDNFCCENALN